jgi:2',3'-cyclic-nucleotide 2'-phosphodiesterase (5'-nucleotidase family)
VNFRIIRSAAILLWFLLPVGAAGQQVSLTILHTNDTHGHLLPFSYPDSASGSGLQGLGVHRNIGGIARRATLVKRIRQELQARGTTVWLVDAGDYSDGTPFSSEYHGEADVTAMNAVGYDLGTIGNHEFNHSLAQLKKLISLTKYQLVCANAVYRDSGASLLPKSVVRTIGELKVGIFGLVIRESGNYQAGKEGILVQDELEAARRTVAELRRTADIVIAISHAGDQTDLKLAQLTPGIDVIVGGHSHSRLPSGNFVWHSEDLRGDDINGTVIVQAHQWGGELGRLDLLFTRDPQGSWHVGRYRSRLVPVTPDIPEDATLAAVVDKYWKPIAPRYGEVIGRAAGEFSSRGDDLAEYHLVDDALREMTGADFAMGNLGGVRAPLLRGDVTLGDMIVLDPFTNTVVTFKATGRQILYLLKRYTPSVSGIRYRVQYGELTEATLGGKPVDESRTYMGVTNSFFAAYALKDIPFQDSGKVRLNLLLEYIRRKGTIRPSYDGRRVVIRK